MSGMSGRYIAVNRWMLAAMLLQVHMHACDLIIFPLRICIPKLMNNNEDIVKVVKTNRTGGTATGLATVHNIKLWEQFTYESSQSFH